MAESLLETPPRAPPSLHPEFRPAVLGDRALHVTGFEAAGALQIHLPAEVTRHSVQAIAATCLRGFAERSRA